MKITLEVPRVTVLLDANGPDYINFTFEDPSPYPTMGYKGTAGIYTETGYAEKWLSLMFPGLPYEVIDSNDDIGCVVLGNLKIRCRKLTVLEECPQ